MIVTKGHLDQAKTERGGYTLGQVALGKKLTGEHRWAGALTGKEISTRDWELFMGMKNTSKRKKTNIKKKLINSVSTSKDWSWKPESKDIPSPKIKSKSSKNKGRNKKRRRRIGKADSKEFYSSREWRELRLRVFEKYECKCMMCGRSPENNGVIIHVDHIKPKSKYPALALSFNNLQLLCEDCNIGKSNKFETDWRPKEDQHTKDLDDEHLTSISHLI